MKENVCEHCGDPCPSFVQSEQKWIGTPVLYMGRNELTGFAYKYNFCDADCLLDWLAETLGMEVA